MTSREPKSAKTNNDDQDHHHQHHQHRYKSSSSSLTSPTKKRNRSWRPQAVLGLSLTEEIPLETVYVGILKDKRTTSKAIKQISSSSPGFGHLKRCNGFRLLLEPVHVKPSQLHHSTLNVKNLTETHSIGKVLENKVKNQPETVTRDAEKPPSSITEENRNTTRSPTVMRNDLQSKGFDVSLLEENFEVIKVPARAARTRRQAEVCSKIWPLNFHPDPGTEAIISGEIFNDYQLSRMELLMLAAIEAARRSSVGNTDCAGSALIVDPLTGESVALAAARINEHPLWHAAMLAIDLVAKSQGGGAWIGRKSSSIAEDSVREEDGGATGGKRKFDRSASPAYRYPPELDDIKLPAAEPLQPEADKTGPYLCTNYWIFMVREPCALCAMALLHSRAAKIFYGVKAEGHGVLGSKAMLHTTNGLNHRYQVWSGILENECRQVCAEIEKRSVK